VVAEARRRWSDAEKHAVVAEAERPGVNISAVARRHGIKPSRLFRWRWLARDREDRQSTPTFVPVTLALLAAHCCRDLRGWDFHGIGRLELRVSGKQSGRPRWWFGAASEVEAFEEGDLEAGNEDFDAAFISRSVGELEDGEAGRQ
jgi:hypothetical protein